MGSNNQSNNVIKWVIIFADIITLNILLWAFIVWHPEVKWWDNDKQNVFWLVNNLALIISEARFYTIIHLRLVSGGEILRRIVELTITYAILAYLLIKVLDVRLPVGWIILEIGTTLFVVLLIGRLFERWFIKLYREAGRNTRHATLVGSDPEVLTIYEKLKGDATLGYRIIGYYADEEIKGAASQNLEYLGTIEELMGLMRDLPKEKVLGDEMYVCLSRKDRQRIRKLSMLCDKNVVRFFYVPVSVETIGLNLKSELLDDMEVYSTYENPLQNPFNRMVKRAFDIVMSLVFLIPTAIIFPIIYLFIKIQSPGPILFKQKRTGVDGKTFNCYKFRSMHVNKDADKVQATKNDPRKYPFGNFMRKANIDELPQFINVMQGKMSIVGPRPHMLAHTEQYSELIDQYMVRHFVKPGVTGWAQVTGFRGETQELWQMEGRVKRDIWYMEHWSIWLDLRIIWMTAKSIFIHDKNAY